MSRGLAVVFIALAALALPGGCALQAQPCTADGCEPGTQCVDGACVVAGSGEVDGAPRLGVARFATDLSFLPGVDLIRPSGYAHRRVITVPRDHVVGAAPLENFPLRVMTSDPTLRPVAAGGDVVDPAGSDIAFYSADGARLADELERWNQDSGFIDAWVRLPLVPLDSDTVIQMLWGRDDPIGVPPSAVWDNTYAAVWHLDDVANGDVADATSHGNVGHASHFTPADAVGGVVGSAAGFSAADATIAVPDGSISGSVTLELWARIDDNKGGIQRMFHRGDSNAGLLELFIADATGTAAFRVDYEDTFVSPSAAVPGFQLGQWHAFVGVFDAELGMVALYVDGQPIIRLAADTTSVPVGNGTSHIGNPPGPSSGTTPLSGVIDEVRMAPRALSPGFIATAYANTRDPAAFVLVGPVEN